MSRTKLKLCPFCSGKAKIHYDYSNFALVQCSKCGIGTLHKPNEVDVVKDWNTRKPMDKVVEQLKHRQYMLFEEVKQATSYYHREELIENIRHYEYAINIVKAGGMNE